MKKRLSAFVVGLLCAAPLTAHGAVNVFACEPEWAALAMEIGGDKVEAFAATSATQDPHHIRARPSLIAKARKADLFLCSGAGLEVGWLPLLLQKASADVQPGAIGYLMAADVVKVLGKPVKVDRSMGDVHPEGNPHVHLNPYNILKIAKELTARLSQVDAAHAAYYQSSYQRFSARWTKSIHHWEAQASILKNKPVVVHHKSFTYLLDWLDMKPVASLEAKPGIPPTASHLESLLRQLKNKPASMILRTPYDSDDASKWLEEKTGTPALILPYTVGGDAQSGDLFKLFDRSITLMKAAHAN